MGATMSPGGAGTLISVKRRSLVRHPAVMLAGAAALAALAGVNVIAFMRGMQTPWLLGVAIISDMLVIGTCIVVAAREVLVAESRTEASQARLSAIVDSAMDAIITVDESQRVVLFNRAAEKLFVCSREDALGTPLERF